SPYGPEPWFVALVPLSVGLEERDHGPPDLVDRVGADEISPFPLDAGPGVDRPAQGPPAVFGEFDELGPAVLVVGRPPDEVQRFELIEDLADGLFRHLAALRQLRDRRAVRVQAAQDVQVRRPYEPVALVVDVVVKAVDHRPEQHPGQGTERRPVDVESPFAYRSV